MRSSLFLILVATVALAAGCGGGNGDATLVKAADDVCRRQHTEIQRVRQPRSRTLPSVAAYLARVQPIAKRANADLHGLKAPAGDRAELWRELLAASDTSLTQIGRMVTAARGRAPVVYNLAARRLADADQTFTHTAVQLGLSVCGNAS